MANIDEFTKAGGKFLKADEVIKSQDKTFVRHGPYELVTDEKFGGERLHIEGHFDGNQKTFNSSRTNARTISDVLGPDTDSWTGATLLLETYKSKMPDGRLVDVVNVKEVRGGTPPVETAAA